MSEDDRQEWDRRWEEAGLPPLGDHGPPPGFAEAHHLLPTSGSALEIACGRGRGAVWLAQRGMEVHAVDVSSVAVELAREHARSSGVEDRCRFDVFDLDQGLPEGPPVDLVLCHLFRDPRLDRALVDRLAPGGMLAIASLSEVGAGSGRYRVPAGELKGAFSDLEIVAEGEGDGLAWLVGRRTVSSLRR